MPRSWREALAPCLLILFCLLWRLPGLADPPWLNDEGTYATVGRALLNGEALYRQVWENKPPAIYLLNALVQWLAGAGQVLVGVRLAALLAALVAHIAVYSLVRWHGDRSVALLATAITGLLLDLPLLDGTAANAEIFLVACTSTGMALLWSQLGKNDNRRMAVVTACAGGCFGMAVLFKLVAGADLLAAFLILLAANRGVRRFQRVLWLLVGLAIPLGAVAIWLQGRGILGDSLYATVGYNLGYAAAGQGGNGAIVTLVSLAVPLLLLLLAGWLLRQARAGSGSIFAAGNCCWLALATLGALASGRSYPHYYLQAVPPLAICVALLAGHFTNRARPSEIGPRAARYRLLGALLVVWTLGLPLASWAALRMEPANAQPGSDQLGYYGHFWRYATGSLDDHGYGNSIDPRVERNVAVANYLQSHPSNPRRLYIWGNAPWIYYLSGYQHAARFLSAYYRPAIPGGQDATLRDLRRDPPPYIVVIRPPKPASAGLDALLRTRYHGAWTVDNAVIYRLVR